MAKSTVRNSFLGMIWVLWSYLTLSMVDGDGECSPSLNSPCVDFIAIILLLLFYFIAFIV